MFLETHKFTSFLLTLTLLIGLTNSIKADTEPIPADYREIPYYLKQLTETKLEDKRLEYNKQIHDAIISADLSKKRVVKKITPLIDEVLKAVDSGLDRPNGTGQATWLMSAVDYFASEKLRGRIDIPESDWMGLQTQSQDGLSIFTHPDKVLLRERKKNKVFIEKDGIHEAVISPDGKHIAFFRTPKGNKDTSEIWVVRVKDKKAKLVATVPKCLTLLFSMNGKRIFYQEKPKTPAAESNIGSVSIRGGKSKQLTSGLLLHSLVGKGRYKGGIIVYKKTKHPKGISDLKCAYAIREDGSEIGRLLHTACE